MRVGFPYVINESGTFGGVVWLLAQRTTAARNSIEIVDKTGANCFVVPNQTGLHSFLLPMMGQWNFTLKVDGDFVMDSTSAFPIGGTSGTVCAFLYANLIEQICGSNVSRDILITGTARVTNQHKTEISPLGDHGFILEKYNGISQDQDFWVNIIDYKKFLKPKNPNDQIYPDENDEDSNLDVSEEVSDNSNGLVTKLPADSSDRKANQSNHSNICVYIAPRSSHPTFGDGEWLLHEFCAKYELDRPARAPKKKDSNDKSPPDPRKEMDLFKAALTQHHEENFKEALQKFCSSNRPSLELHSQLLDSLDVRLDAAGNVIDDRGFFRSDFDSVVRHTFIAGPTGCGKTSLIYSLIVNVLHMARRLLYLGPVKALVEEFHSNVNEETFKNLLPERCREELFISTGDHSVNDAHIASGQFSFAAMVYEKANVLLSSGTEEGRRNLFASLDAVIIDELQMLQDSTRGDVLDVLIAKLALENEQRSVQNVQPIQIVMISTEGIVSEIKNLDIFKNKQDRRRPIDPLTFTVTQRLPPVKHVLYHPAMNDAGSPVRREAQLCLFESQSDRQHTVVKINALTREIESYLRQVQDGATINAVANGFAALRNNPVLRSIQSPKKAKKKIRSLAASAIHNLIASLENPNPKSGLPHQSIIVACNATSHCDSLAAGLFNIRKGIGIFYVSEIAENFDTALDESEFDATRKNQLREWARLGVFVHNSQLPARIRHAIEVIFRQQIFPNSRCRVLFTTETLTYGVNLSASAVVLTDIAFTRSDPVSPTEKPLPESLTPTQFHNLLGRAGRKSFDADADAVAYISTTNSERGTDPIMNVHMQVQLSALNKFLQKFYGEQVYSKSLPISKIAHRSDLDKSSDPEPSESAKPAPTLLDFSYSIFRTVLESVRLAKSANAEEIKHQFRRTIGYLHADKALKEDLDRLFAKVFGLIKDYKEIGQFTLFAEAEGLFKLQYSAVALLDTGTSLHAVEPIAIWLEILREVNNKEPEGVGHPIEAILPALVAAPEFTQSANELLHVAQLANILQTPDSVESAREKSIAYLTDALADSGMGPEYVAAVQRYVGGTRLDNVDTAPISSPRFSVFRGLNVLEGESLGSSAGGYIRDITYYLLLSGVFRWVQGKPMTDMHTLFIANHTKGFVGKSWQPKHADRLEQLASMTGKFFTANSRFLTKYLHESMALKLPKFALRCKYGISEECLVYRRVLSPAEGLPRKVILAIKDCWPDPMQLLETSSPLNVQQILAQAGVEVPHLSDNRVKSVVRTAYAQSASSFLAQLGDERSEEYLDQAYLALREPNNGTGELLLSPHWRAADLMDIVSKYVPALAEELSVSRSCKHFEILEWHSVTGEHKSITPFACLFLGALLLREQLSIELLRRQLASCGSDVTITVAWVASNLWITDHLTNTPYLREVALAFLEPRRIEAQIAVSSQTDTGWLYPVGIEGI